MILLCFFVFILYIAIESFRVRPGGKRRLEIRFWLFSVGVALALAFRRWFEMHAGALFWPQTTATEIVADAAALAGLAVALWSRRTLGNNWSSEIAIQKHHALVERGPYAYLRHPMYSGILLMLLGAAVYFGRYAWLVLFFSCLLGLYLKSRREERLLMRAFPDYPNYQRRTKALIPFVL